MSASAKSAAFLRFVCPARVAGMDAQQGFFAAAYALRENTDLDRSTLTLLEGV